MTFPSPPWQLQGQLWLSLFYAAAPERPSGLYGVAFASYEPGGTLSYSELLVARRLKVDDQRRVTVVDMWVDSPESMEGGRALWGMPKQLAEFDHDLGGLGAVGRVSWAARADGEPIASADFADVSRVAPRVPLSGSTWQTREDGSEAVATVKGSGKSLPCLAHWEFAAGGPLGWLHGKQPVSSFRVADLTMTFG